MPTSSTTIALKKKQKKPLNKKAILFSINGRERVNNGTLSVFYLQMTTLCLLPSS